MAFDPFTAYLVIAIVSAGASYVQAKKAQKKAQEMSEGVEANIESNSKEIPVVYGERRVGGTRVYIDTSRDEKHQYLYMVLAMAEGEVESITDIKIDDISIEDDRFRYDGALSDRNLEFEVYLGSLGQEASTLIGNGVSYDYDRLGEIYNDPYADQHERDAQDPNRVLPWSSKHKLSGIAYLALKFKWDEGAYTGIPEVTAVVKGRKVYDPRTGVTAWSDNPALCIRDYLTNKRFGKGLPDSAIDDIAFSQAANDLDSFIAYPYQDSPEYQYLFRMNHVVDTSKKIMENLNEMIIACRGFIPYSNGVYSLKIDQTSSSVLDIGADQIISGIAIAGARKEDRFNQVKVNFFNASLNYKEDQAIYPEQNSTLYQQYLTEDEGEPLVDEIDLYSINNYYSAREMARLFLERSRQNMTIAFQGTSELINLEVGEVVSITHPTPAWVDKLFQVQEVALAFDGTVQITCIEYDAALYTYDTPEQEQPYIGTRLPDPNQVDPPTALSTDTGTYIEADGKAIGYIDLSWSAPEDSLVDRYELKFEYSSREEVIELASTEYRFKPTQDNVSYVISVRAVNGLGIRSAWLTAAAITAVVDTTAPSDITGITATGGLQSILLEWTNPTEDDFDLVRIKHNTVNTQPDDHSFQVRSNSFLHDIGAYSTTKHYWLAPVDRTGNVGNYVSAGSATTGSIDYSDVLNPPTIPEVATTVYLTLGDNNAPTDAEFNTAVGRYPIENDFVVVNKEFAFNYNGTAWVAVTEFIDGSLLVTGSLSASDITTGTLNANDVTISNLTVAYDTQVTGTPDLSEFITGGDVNANVTSISGGVIQTGTAVTVGTSNNVAILSGADADYRIWAGNVSPSLANFKVHKDGTVNATGAVIDGNITADSLDVENATITGTLTAPIGWSNSVYFGVINRGNLSESVKDLIDERIAEVSGGISGDFGQDDGSFNLDSQLDDDPQVNNITHESGKNITIELSGSRSWNRTFIGLPVVDMDVSISIQRSLAGANSWSTIATITDTSSSITTSTYLVHSGTQGYSISIYHTIAQDPASGNYDYRAITNGRGSAYNVSIPLQLTVVEPATIGAGNADTLDNQNGTYYLDYNNFTNTPSTTNWDTAYGWGNHASAGYLKYTASSGSAGESAYLLSIGKSTDHQYIQSHDSKPLRLNPLGNAVQIGTGNDAIFHNSYHPNADKWTTARTLSLTGDVTGSVSWDGSANASLTATVANDSHTHDGRYYTESESDSRFARVYKGTATINTSYTTIATVSGDRLASSIDMTIQGTSNGVVINVDAKILVNHSQDILIKTESGIYTQIQIKVTSNNNESYAIEIARVGGSGDTGVAIEIFPRNSEAVTFTGSHSFTGSSLNHQTYVGTKQTATGGGAYHLVTDGNISSQTYEIDGATVINSSRNLTNIGTFQNGSMWVNDGSAGTSYNENIRLFDPTGGVASVIAFGATGISGSPRNSILSYNLAGYGLDFRKGNTRKLSIQDDVLIDNASLNVTSGAYKVNSTTVIDSSRNLTNINRIDLSGSAIRSNSTIEFLTTSNGAQYAKFYGASASNSYSIGSYGGYFNALNGFMVNNTTVIDSSRNLSNISNINISSSTANITFANSGTTKRGVTGTMGDNDQWFIGGGASSSNVGYLEISTGDDGQTLGSAEEIRVVQYGAGSPFTGTAQRTLKLLDVNGNTIIPRSLEVTNNITTSMDIYGKSVNGSYSNLYRFGGIYFTWDSDSYGNNTHHSIRSTYGDAYGDNITLNSFGHVRINFDSNSNGANFFEIGHATTGTGNTLLRLEETGFMRLGNDGYPDAGLQVYMSDKNTGGVWDTYCYMGRTNVLENDTTAPVYEGSGNIGFKVQANSDGAFFGIEEYSTGNYRAVIEWGDDAGEDLYFRHVGNTRAYLTTGGSLVVTGNVTAYSDITLKDNIELIPNALEKVCSVRGVTYNRTDENSVRQTGVIAQEIEKILPEAVQSDKDGIKSVAYGNMVGLLIEAIKELKSEIEELKNGNNTN